MKDIFLRYLETVVFHTYVLDYTHVIRDSQVIHEHLVSNGF